MKIKLNRSAIQSALKRIGGAVPPTSTMEIMTHIVVRVTGGRAVWTGGKMETQVSVTTEVDADEDGIFTLPARKFLTLINGLQGNTDITLDVSGLVTTMRAGRSKYILNGMDPTMYPRQTLTPKFTIAMPAATLAEMLTYVAPCMSTGGDMRLFTHGIYLNFTGKQMDAVATEGCRMGYASEPIESDAGNVFVHRDSVQQVLGVLAAGDSVELGVDDRKFKIVVGDYELIGSQVDSRYIEYSRVINQARDYIYVPAAEMKAAINRMVGFADAVGRCEIILTANEMRLRAGVGDQADEVIAIEGGRDASAYLVVGQVKDVLDVSTGEMIGIGISHGNAYREAVLWRESDEASRHTIIMQLRV